MSDNEICEQLKALDIKSLTTYTMANTRDEIMRFIKLIAPFDGDVKYLTFYVDQIDSHNPPVLAAVEEKLFYFQCVLTTLRGSALDLVRREQPSSWATLKELLISEFADCTPLATMILSIDKLKFKGNVRQLCEELNNEICNIKDNIKLREKNALTKTFLNNELNQISLRVIKRELPDHLTALVNANGATDVQSAIKTLKENNEYVCIQTRFQNNRNKNVDAQNRSYANVDRKQGQNQFYLNPQYNTPSNFHASQIAHLPNNDLNTFNPYHTFNYPFSNTIPMPTYYQPQYNPQYTRPNNSHVSQHGQFKNGNAINNNNRSRPTESNQSRIRRFGAPEPMDLEAENFRLEGPSDPYQQ